jgi:protease-4
VPRRTVLATLAIAVVIVMTLAGLVLALRVEDGTGGLGWGGARIGLLEIDGIIADDERLLEQLRRFRRDRSVRGILVAINSPGGVVGPAQSVYRELRRAREEDGLPVVASIGAIGASGGYYVALAADSIFALPGSITGSIGVLMEFPNAAPLLDRVGVSMEVIKSADQKDAGSPFRPVTDADRAMLRSLVEDVYDQFLEAVAAERGLEQTAVARIGDGRILSGRQALEAGLVDRLGNERDALEAVGIMAGLGPDPRVTRPPRPRPTLLDLLLGRSGAARAAGTWPLPEPGLPRLRYALPWQDADGLAPVQPGGWRFR